MSNEKLEKLLQQEQQLRARIQKEKSRLNQKDRAERTGRLIAWGVMVEQMLLDTEESLTAEQLAMQCKRFLNGRTLERALSGPLAEYQEKPELEPV